MDANLTWIKNEFSQIDCNDLRLNQRFMMVAQSMMESPGESIHQAMGDWKRSKGAYRLFDNDKVSRQEILSIHAKNTLGRVNDTGQEEIILSIQDSSTINYTHHPKKEGLKKLHQQEGFKKCLKGFHLHNTFLMTEDGLPLGLLQQEVFQNDAAVINHKRRPIEDKKSYHWLMGLQAVSAIRDRTVITICDREADIYEFLMEAKKLEQYYVIRSSTDRKLVIENEKLRSFMAKQSIISEIEINIPGNGLRKTRKAILEIRYAKVSLKPPQRAPEAKKAPLVPLEVNAILATEKNPSPGIEALDWMLLSNYPVNDFSQAVKCLRWYKSRWNIEEFHKILKSGCNIEDCQLQTFERVNKYIALMSVIAFRLFYITLVNRVTPEESCTIFLKEHEWQSLCLATKKEVPAKPPLVREAVRMIGQLGGFLARKSDGEPGITVIWRGWEKLQIISDFFLATLSNNVAEKRCG